MGNAQFIVDIWVSSGDICQHDCCMINGLVDVIYNRPVIINLIRPQRFQAHRLDCRCINLLVEFIKEIPKGHDYKTKIIHLIIPLIKFSTYTDYSKKDRKRKHPVLGIYKTIFFGCCIKLTKISPAPGQCLFLFLRGMALYPLP